MLRATLLPLALLLAARADAHARVGDRIDRLAVTLLDHAKVDAAALRGQVVIVNFWATWCGPCKTELPLIDAYYRAHAGEGLRVFAVASDDSVPPQRLGPLSAALAFPLARGVAGSGLEPLAALPTNYVIDRTGVVRYVAAGAFDAAALDEIVGPLLAAPAPSADR